MHILLMALVGGLIGIALTVIVAKVSRKPITPGMLVGGFLGGAVSGALAATALATSLIAAGGVRAVSVLAVQGASSGAVSRMSENVVDHHPVLEHVGESAAIGAVLAPAGHYAGRVITTVAPKVLPAPLIEPFDRVAKYLPAPLKRTMGVSLPPLGEEDVIAAGAAVGRTSAAASGVTIGGSSPATANPPPALVEPVTRGLAGSLRGR